MVKEVQLTRVIPSYTPKLYFEAVHEGGECIRQFHAQVDNTHDTTWTDWNGGRRSVSFTQPVNAPDLLKRIVGMDNVEVTEEQEVTFQPDGSIALTSVPVPNMPGGNKFSTRVETLLGTCPAGCQVSITVVCSAAGPFGLVSTIEGFMAQTARDGILQWLDFVQQYLQQLPAPAAAETAEAAPAAEPGEEFYDASEAPLAPLEEDQGPAIPTSHPLPDELVPSTPLTFEEGVLLYLRYMCRTGDQSCGLLEGLDKRLRSLERDMAAIRAAVVAAEEEDGDASGAKQQRQQQQQQQQAAPAAQRQNGQQQQQPVRWQRAAPAAAQQAAAPRSLWCAQVSLRKALLGAGLLATASATATALYFRRQAR